MADIKQKAGSVQTLANANGTSTSNGSANAAGTEFIGTGVSVPANSYVDWYGEARLDAADFLVGGASAITSLTISGEGEIGVAG